MLCVCEFLLVADCVLFVDLLALSVDCCLLLVVRCVLFVGCLLSFVVHSLMDAVCC